MSVNIIGNFIMCRSVHDHVISANPSVPTQVVSNAGLYLSLNDSGAIDYTFYKVNPTAGEALLDDPKNQVRFNLSPIIKDVFTKISPSYKTWANVVASANQMQSELYCLCQIETLRNGVDFTISGMNNPQIASTYYMVAFNGFRVWEDDNQLMNIGNFYDWVEPSYTILIDRDYQGVYDIDDTGKQGGNIYLYANNATDVIYTNLRTGATQTATLTANTFHQVPSVHPSYVDDGNMVSFDDGVVRTFDVTFTPKEECKYDVLVCDFISKYGVWKRIYFFKASFESLETTSTDFISSTLTIDNYGQFDTNGKDSIKVNTDWVDESFNVDLKELMLSERILLDGKAVKMRTKSTQLEKNINNKTINYTLEFEYLNDVIRGEQ